MYKYLIYFTLYVLASTLNLHAAKRASSAPYISGDSFRFSADFTYDDISKDMNPKKVFEGSTVFVKTDYLQEFFTHVHPKINSRYKLITHNSDHPIPGKFASRLDDDKIIAWFGQNVENYRHEKLYPIPIGVANRCWKHGNIKTLSSAQKKIGKASRNILLYMNFSKSTHPERNGVFNLFRDKKYCYKAKPKGFVPYLNDLTRSMFVLSPRGNGVDCHRTWEALLMGAVPIVASSCLDPLFEDLPVLIVQDWSEIDAPYLKKQYLKLQSKAFNQKKLYIDYWLKFISSTPSFEGIDSE